MATDIQPAQKRKPVPVWMIGLAGILLLVDVKEFVTNFNSGIWRALDLYPLDTAEMVGYDIARVLMFAFVIWVGWRLAANKISN